jgi:GntR family transcriptional regulator/MocR family aminotransferase
MAPLIKLDFRESPGGLPLSKKLSEAIGREIRRGRFRPGDLLPSSRALAESLSVHRNTVIAAYEALAEQGYIQTQAGRGTFVSESLPDTHRPRRASDRTSPIDFHLAPPSPPATYRELGRDTIALLPGLPDLREAPLPALARAYRAALKNAPTSMDYQGASGHPRLLKELGRYLASQRGVTVLEGEMLITRGSQQAIHLAARALHRRGAVIAVERCGYPPAWEALRLAGAELVPVRVDKNGLVTDELARLCEARDVAAVYVTPHHQYPTTVTMSAARRLRLLRLAEEKRFVILEDDYDHEYHFSQHPIFPLKSVDTRGVVLYIGTLSKVFAPGLRIGYVVGQKPIIDHMATSRTYLDRQGDHTTELAVSYLLEDGEFGAHVRRMHRKYESRRKALFGALKERLGSRLTFRTPQGGLAVWAKVEGGISPSHWAARALERNVVVMDGKQLFFDGRSRPYLRLGFARHREDELVEGVRRLAAAWPGRA